MSGGSNQRARERRLAGAQLASQQHRPAGQVLGQALQNALPEGNGGRFISQERLHAESLMD
jgi:hypothetical protein